MERLAARAQSLREKAKSTAGVTLIELLAVIVILAIIAAIAVPAVMGQIATAKKNADKHNEQIIVDAMSRMILDAEGKGKATTFALVVNNSAAATSGDAGTAHIVLPDSSVLQDNSSTPSTDLKNILLNGLAGNTGQTYLNQWPMSQSSTSKGWTFTKGPVTNQDTQVPFSISGVQWFISPSS